MSPEGQEAEELAGGERQLRLVVEILLGPECPAGVLPEEVLAIRHHASKEGHHCEFVTSAGPDASAVHVHHVTRPLESACFCTVFGDHGCVPHITRVTDDSVVVETYLEDRDDVWQLLASLEEVSAGVRLVRLTTTDVDRSDVESGAVALSVLTTKQREALERALERGYFNSPKEATLEELADEFDISISALSQRLHAAHRKLLNQLFPEKADQS